MAAGVAFKATAGPGDAHRLAAAAVEEGYDVVVAAGGDGTLNEVLNGIASVPGGLERVRLGVLPLGTVNVFARELKISLNLRRAWEVLRRGNETRIDLACAEYQSGNRLEKRYFAQLAGAGLDARTIELVSWQLKKKAGPLAYVVAGLRAMLEAKPKTIVRVGEEICEGEWVLVGNGRFYGGSLAVFPGADLQNGLLDVCVISRVDVSTLLRCVPHLLLRQRLSERVVRRFQTDKFELKGRATVAFELDGEWVGHLPATFSVTRRRLRVVVP